jgi:segregation and condensation protein A
LDGGVNAPFQPGLDFEAARTAADDGEALIIDIEGYEGPLHVLLALAQRQKVDLLKLSITRLADQYLAFVRQASRRRFALAADYLVMAAWLAFLKSRLLLPKAERPSEPEAPAEIVAAQLAFRLAKLDAMRRAAEALDARPILKRDVFTRGAPETTVVSHRRVQGDLHTLMAAYVRPRAQAGERTYRPPQVVCFRLDDAREHLRSRLPSMRDWIALDRLSPEPAPDGPSAASCLASTLSASLEYVREGALEARQLAPFETVYLRRPPAG